MAYKNRFHKTTLGVDAQVLVAKAVAYSVAADLKAFVSTAVEGELAIIKTSDNTVATVAGGALAAGTEVFLAVKRDGNVETSTPFTIGSVTKSKTAYVAPVKHQVTVVTTAPGTFNKGDLIELCLIETTPGMQPLPTTNYGVQAKAGETWVQAIARLVALINDSTSIENQNRTQIVTASTANAGLNIVLDAKNFGEHFAVGLRGLLVDQGSQSVTVQFKLGNGTPEQVKIAEENGDIRKGVTTNYPDQNATPAEFGAPTSFSDANGSTAQYQSTVIKLVAEDRARTGERITRSGYIFLFTPSNGAANPTAAVNTILAV